MTEIGYRKSN